MKGRQLLQYLIDTSDVVPAKKQEATEYLAKLEAAQQSVQPTEIPAGDFAAKWVINPSDMKPPEISG